MSASISSSVCASMYDGGTALMEAAMLATTVGKKKKIVVSEGVFSSSREILKTYAHARGTPASF